MKLGIIADTHDNLGAIKFLVNYFNGQDAELLIHPGDFIAPFTVPPLADFNGPTHEYCIEDRNNYQQINPGEAGGWLTGLTSGALFETFAGKIERIAVSAP